MSMATPRRSTSASSKDMSFRRPPTSPTRLRLPLPRRWPSISVTSRSHRPSRCRAGSPPRSRRRPPATPLPEPAMQGFDVTAILLNPQLAGMLVDGFWVTLIIAAGSWLLAMSLGILLLVIRLMPSRIAERAVRVYVSYHSNVPTLVQLMIWYFGIASLLPSGLQDWLSAHYAETTFAIIGLGLCQAAYFSEDLRSGLRSVAAGQEEAARALGHS